ncbi:Fructose-1-phosphate kinase and related fructose-6-phosphate kinase (PfkB) [Streptococcus suis 05ZYH33]|nr:Fructose-1-phosphate kinase and related fructose-6-phosphate kinase (PfkB) [Streptococcus suis 05ZYH33]
MIHLICPNPALDRTLLVEKIEKNIPLRPTEVRDYPGGKSFNVAYALRENGVTELHYPYHFRWADWSLYSGA